MLQRCPLKSDETYLRCGEISIVTQQTCVVFTPCYILHKLMILLVEDEVITRYAFAQILRFEGHDVMEAADGVEALRLLDEHNFDIMITDLVMPRVDGFALVAETRLKWPNVRIVLMSGYVAEYAAAALDGSTEFLPKPIEPTVLVATVRRLLPTSD
jgi:CheY-like chemotaxis protein